MIITQANLFSQLTKSVALCSVELSCQIQYWNLDLFIKWRICYIESLNIMNLRGNDPNVPYIEVIVND